MRLFACFLLLFVTQILCRKDCVLDNGSRDLNWEWKLKKYLIRCTESSPPENKTTVSIRFILKSFKFDNTEEVLFIYSWVFYSWIDERIKWDPGSYGNISTTILDAIYIWTPQIKHHSRFEVFEDYDLFSERCEITNTGWVSCMVREVHQTECNSNLTTWPFDTQSCTFKYGPSNADHGKVGFSFNSTRGISMFGAEYGPGWNIIDYDKGEDPNSTVQLYLTFIVERQGMGLEAVIVIPSVVLSVLTMSSIFLELDEVRLIITFLSLAGHYYFLQELSENIPRYGAQPPNILRFITISLTFTTAAFIVTFILRKLERRTVSPPHWVISMTDYVLGSPGKYIILPRLVVSWSTNTERTNKVPEWIAFTNILNSISILIGVIIYIVLFSSSLPKQNPIDSYSL